MKKLYYQKNNEMKIADLIKPEKENRPLLGLKILILETSQIYHQKDPLQIGLESLSKKIAILDQINTKNHNQIP